MADLREQLQSGLAARYRLERELGRGGMATVLLAHDLRHKRSVALKVLHPELALTLGPDRFRREIETVARLQHPHILTVHDSGETAGQLWYTMPFVDGESLRDRLRREGQLPLEDALQITREVADALGYAHRQGVVHRDVKPENILLSEGHALVADFGVARAIQSAGGEQLTQTGSSVGTPAYMSPEQSMADPALDGRSDLYSLGCVFYEMLTGEVPYTGPSAQAIIAKRLLDPVPSARRLRETIPLGIDLALQRGLAKAPADRFQTAAQFAHALSTPASDDAHAPLERTQGRPTPLRVVAAVVLTLLVGLVVGMIALSSRRSTRSGDGLSGAGSNRLAVLPFENQGAPADEYFADGVTDEVRGKLAALPGLQVIARSSSSQYKGTHKPPQQIGQELGVRYLLTATVRWEKAAGSQSRVRVSPELIQVATGSTRWQQPFDAPLTDVFEVQSGIAERVADALGVALGATERRVLQAKPTENLAAYEAYLKGNERYGAGALGSTIPNLRGAVEWYERAVMLDSLFALAWIGLSRGRTAMLYMGATPAQANLPAARTAAERALSLIPDLPEGHLALGDYYGYGRRDWGHAVAEYAQARERAPRSAEILVSLAGAERARGQWEQAVGHLQRAATLDPRSQINANATALALLYLRRYAQALEAADGGIRLAPESPAAHHLKSMVYLAQGDSVKARQVIDAAARQIEPSTLLPYWATYFDLFWALDSLQRALLLRLAPASFGEDTTAWGLALAGARALRGDLREARAYADSARTAAEGQLKAIPGYAQIHALLGLAFAYMGRPVDAVREGEQGVRLLPPSEDAYEGPYLRHQLARIYLLVGKPEKALDQLELLLKIPYYLSPGWLRIDPTFASLRGNPRFERLVKGA